MNAFGFLRQKQNKYSAPKPEWARRALRALKAYWFLMLLTPVVYLLICDWALRRWGGPNGWAGFWPFSRQSAWALVGALGIAGAAGQWLIARLHRSFDAKLAGAGRNAPEFAYLLKRRLALLGLVCDSTAALGLIAFLAVGDLRTMLAFGVAAYAYYAQIAPGESWLAWLSPAAEWPEDS